MNLALWIIAIVLAIAFAGSGLMKQFVPKDKLVAASVVHARRKEPLNIVVNVVLIALAVVVAWGRFGPYSFTP